jgi:periplasmic divalent cation tolerance protein
MPEPTTEIRLVLTTCASADQGKALGHVLVEERLAACATILPSVESIYRWEGKMESASETLVLLKTTAELVEALQGRLLALHSYQTPEFLVLGVEGVSHPYLEWLQSSLRQP